VRLIVARCEVSYSGRLNAFLPESTRPLMLKDDGSVLVHADAGGYKPLNSGFTLRPTGGLWAN
jgi:RecB family endonuclease NucS